MSVCYSISIDDAVAYGYSLSKATKQKLRFLDIAEFLDRNTFKVLEFDAIENPGKPFLDGIPTNAQPYAALSYPWRDLAALDANLKTFKHADLDPVEQTPTSVDLLTTVCIAAKQQECKYLWMDKLCIRQDNQVEGKEDHTWQMKRMYSIYKNCEVCLVAGGGMVRLPRLCEKTTWIDRAWTLQEALAPEKVRCLFAWNSGDKGISNGTTTRRVRDVQPGVAMLPLSFLLAANLRAKEPKITITTNSKGKPVDVVELPEKPDSQVYYFGNRYADDWPITALQGALERPNPIAAGAAAESELSARRLGIWRCITMRNARYAEDFVFATMGIFGVIVEPLLDPTTGQVREQSYPEDEIQELLDDYLKKLSIVGSRADWFAVAPELGPARETTALPLVPDINFTKDKDGKPASTTVKKLLRAEFNWYLSDALEYVVDAPNGIEVTAPAHVVEFALNLQPEDPTGPSFGRIHDGSKFEVVNIKGNPIRYAIVIGRKAQYDHSTPSTTGDDQKKDEVLLMLVEDMPFTKDRFRNIGYAWVQDKFVKGWETKKLSIGLRGG